MDNAEERVIRTKQKSESYNIQQNKKASGAGNVLCDNI